MMTLDPTVNKVILRFEYAMDYKHLQGAIDEYNERKQEYKNKIIPFISNNTSDYFKVFVQAVDTINEANTIPFKEKLENIINFQRIHAKRAVNNEPGSNRKNDKTLSNASAKYYEKLSSFKKQEVQGDKEVKELQEKKKVLHEKLGEADLKLNDVYLELFASVLEKVQKFGGIKTDDSKITIKSTLEGRNILRENTSVIYRHDKDNKDYTLPEDYNGLGYMNLINMIFEIEMLFMGFKKAKPADINIIFIEEPEAHTHPQMQHIFIENIKSLLTQNKEGLKNSQTIISTHSPHIVSKSDFEDIKYFRKEGKSIISKNLKELNPSFKKEKSDTESKTEEQKEQSFRFLKQYLTLNKAELFFADKAIFIEGDTERILLPAMMKKIDIENEDENITSLLSQHISIIEAGAYAQVFEKFIEFLGIKVLIITDLDAVKKVKAKNNDASINDKFALKKCPVTEGERSNNSSINHFLKNKFNTFEELRALSEKDKILANNKVRIAYQIEEGNYHARSFEDAFINLTFDFISEHKSMFKGLKNRSTFTKETSPYFLAERCISNDNKTAFALDIFYFGGENFKNWQIPH